MTEVIEPDQRRPMTALQRLRFFMVGIHRLLDDYYLFRNIHDACRTRRNAWKIPVNRPTSAQLLKHKDPLGLLPLANIPRRQHEQQRRIMMDVSALLPLVSASLIPIAGYIPMILAVLAPRQLLSRHFYNSYEFYHFADIEYQQRTRHYEDLYESFRHQTDLDLVHLSIIADQEDEAGPLFDPVLFLAPLLTSPPPVSTPEPQRLRHHNVSSFTLQHLPRIYLIDLALSVGILQSLPDWASTGVIKCLPNTVLVILIRRKMDVIMVDDVLLLRDGYHQTGCTTLTDVELVDACLTRGLPVSSSRQALQQCLTNYLLLIEGMYHRLSQHVLQSEAFGLAVLHVPILRQVMKRRAQKAGLVN